MRPTAVLVLFLIGGVAALLGDHGHVVTGTTFYTTDAVPFLGSSPVWFPVLVGLAAVSLAEIRLHLPSVRTAMTLRQGLAGIAAVVGSYLVTALVHTGPAVPTTALISAFAVLIWCAFGDTPALVCGALAAVIGPVVEIVLAHAGLFGYAEVCDGLFGVAPWLVPLYFAFGVVAALLGELASARAES